MILFALWGFVIGAMLGAHTVAALVPVTILTLLTAGGVSAVGSEGFGPTAIELTLLLVCLQFGYLGGAALRFSSHDAASSERPLSKSARANPPSVS